jgi:hypothetical protein
MPNVFDSILAPKARPVVRYSLSTDPFALLIPAFDETRDINSTEVEQWSMLRPAATTHSSWCVSVG